MISIPLMMDTKLHSILTVFVGYVILEFGRNWSSRGWPSWCGCIVCAMSDEQQCAMCLSDYDLSRIKISWRSLLEFLRGFVCLDEAPYTAR